MGYIADLIERAVDDENAQQLCNQVSVHLNYLASHGLDGFMLVPVQNNGRTESIIVAARGERPGTEEGRRAFQELTGLDSPDQL